MNIHRGLLIASAGVLIAFHALPSAAEIEIEKHPMALGGWVDFGRAQGIDPVKFRSTSDVSKDVVLSHTGIYFVQSATALERLRLDIGFVGYYFFPFPQHPTQGWWSFLSGGTGVLVAAGTYSFGDMEKPWLKATVGWHGYKYNRFAKTFGEYMFRTESYPVFLRSGEYSAINNAKASLFGSSFTFSFMDGLITNDFLVTLSTRYPIADISFTDIASLNFGRVFEIGGGVNLCRIAPMFPKKTDAIYARDEAGLKLDHAYMTWTAEDAAWVDNHIAQENAAGDSASSSWKKYRIEPLVVGQTYWLGSVAENGTEGEIVKAYKGNATKGGVKVYQNNAEVPGARQQIQLADMTLIGFRSIKLMGRAGFDIKPLIGAEEIFNPDALQLYTEVAVLGLENHPVYYPDIAERMPIMAGFNLPTFKLLDYLTVEIEYVKNPWLNSYVAAQLFATPVPKLLDGDDASAVPRLWLDQERTTLTAAVNDSVVSGAWTAAKRDSLVGCVDPSYHQDWVRLCDHESQVDYHEDDFKWAVTAAKSFPPVTVMFHVANDHYAPIQANTALRDTELTNRRKSWYYMIKLQVDL